MAYGRFQNCKEKKEDRQRRSSDIACEKKDFLSAVVSAVIVSTGAVSGIAIAAAAISAVGAAAPGTAGWFFAVCSLGFFEGPAFKDCLAGQTDFAVFDSGNHNGELVTKADDVFNTADAFAVQLGNVNHAIDAGENFHESAEIGGADDLAGVDVAEDRCFDEPEDLITGSVGIGLIGRRNINEAAFFDIDLGVGIFLQLADMNLRAS